jgi:mannose-6-phosphate isomerase-like protein (cupin superfamily)
MEIESTLLVLGASAVNAQEGVTQGQSLRPMIGNAQHPTDRLRVALANYEPNTLEQLHWHPIEACYFVVSGSAIVRDINNKEYQVGPGTIIYCPPGIAGAHEWEVKDKMQLLSIRASTESDKKLQFTVDKKTRRSYIDLEDLAKRDAISFKSHY